MDLSDLRAFVMLAETLNFTRSAEALFVSQSTFSRQISRLEAEIGMPLFVRSPRSVTLTEFGRVFLPEARQQISAWETSLRHMQQVRNGSRGRFVLGFIQDNPNDRIPEILRAYRQSYPEVDLELREYGQGAITRALETGEVDAGFTFAEGLDRSPEVESRLVSISPMCAVLRAEHPLCHDASGRPRSGLSLKELDGEDLVLISQEVSIYGYQNVLERCRRAGIAPEISATAKILPSLFMLVEAGMGFAFLPETAARMAPAGVSFLQLSDCDDSLAMVLAWRGDNQNPCLEEFLATADQICRAAD